MNMNLPHKLSFIPILVLLALSVSACNPGGPGARKYHPEKYERYVLLDIDFASAADRETYGEIVKKLQAELFAHTYLDHCDFSKGGGGCKKILSFRDKNDPRLLDLSRVHKDETFFHTLGVGPYKNNSFLKKLTLYIPRNYLYRVRIRLDLVKNKKIHINYFRYALPVRKPIYQEMNRAEKWIPYHNPSIGRLEFSGDKELLRYLKDRIITPGKRDMLYR